MRKLQALLTLLDDDSVTYVSTAEALRAALLTDARVQEVRDGLDSGAVRFDEVQAFVRDLIAHFEPGVISDADVVLSAIATAFETWPARHAARFLDELAAISISELPFASRVARLAREERDERIAKLTFRSFEITALITPPGVVEERPSRTNVNTDAPAPEVLEAA